MAKRFLQALLSATALVSTVAGCGGGGFHPPSDEEMIRNFYAHEEAFVEIAGILSACTYGDTYPPFSPIEHDEDSLCLASLGPDRCARLDSLLDTIGCERVRFISRHSLWQQEHRDYDSIPPVGELPDTVVSRVYFTYYAAGWSIGPSVDKEYVYDPEYPVADIGDGDLNGLYEQARADAKPYLIVSKPIKDGWHIELLYDR